VDCSPNTYTCCRKSYRDKQAVSRAEQWKKLPVGKLKINVDGAFKEDCMDGTGAILRDENGTFIAASTRWLPAVLSALQSEVEAIRDGILLLDDGEQRGVIDETDSKVLVDLWHERTDGRYEISPILQDIQERSYFFSFFI
jgi:hypothetical protein